MHGFLVQGFEDKGNSILRIVCKKLSDWRIYIEQLLRQVYTQCMTDAKSRKKRICESKADEIQAAINYGIDISMLTDSINRSYAERISRHQSALNGADKLCRAKRI